MRLEYTEEQERQLRITELEAVLDNGLYENEEDKQSLELELQSLQKNTDKKENIMNEWYAKDTSKKIKAVFKAKMRDGKRVSGAVPYGYYRKPEDKQTLYVDEASASVVRRIFQLACDGMGATAIADTLSEDKILIPSAYARQNHPEDCQCTNYHDPYTWNATTVGYILNRREYLGHTVLGKTTRDNFKTKRKRIANEDELLVFYNTHEAIIDQETYDKAQRMRKRVSPR